MRKIKDPRILGGLGGLTLAAGLILQRFMLDWSVANFVIGILIGLSLVFNVKALLIWRAQRVDQI